MIEKGCMRRGENHQTAGQLLYELMASKDKTSSYWPEWRTLSVEQKEGYENFAIEMLQRLQDDQESDDSP